jgi:hypothetical protein
MKECNMENDYLHLTKEELLTIITQLQMEIHDLQQLMGKVREHKHNYSEDFGLVVVAPIEGLVNELLINKEVFTEDEIRDIVESYKASMQMHGAYECLGWPVDIQLKRVKESMVPQIRKNSALYTSILQRKVKFNDKWLVGKMQMACDETDNLCTNLANIEHFDYGSMAEPFKMYSVIREVFNQDNLASGYRGKSPIRIEYYFGEYTDVKVNMNQKGFCKYLLGNIIKNLHEHAFKEIDELELSQKITKKNYSWWTKLVVKLLPLSVRMRFMTIYKDAGIVDIPEKSVRISIRPDKKDPKRIELIIENNGKAFYGDIAKVFENGIGEGSGIGLYSAQQFLKAYNANITMFTNANDEYKVGFIINTPIV